MPRALAAAALVLVFAAGCGSRGGWYERVRADLDGRVVPGAARSVVLEAIDDAGADSVRWSITPAEERARAPAALGVPAPARFVADAPTLLAVFREPLWYRGAIYGDRVRLKVTFDAEGETVVERELRSWELDRAR